MLRTTIAGSLPKPAWLARPEMLWAPWALPPDTLASGQRDAVLIALKEQEAAGIDVVTDGEQIAAALRPRISRAARRHRLRQAGDDRHPGRPLQGRGPDRDRTDRPPPPVHLDEVRWARAHTERRLKFTIPGPMTIVDTLADEHYRRPRAPGHGVRAGHQRGGARPGGGRARRAPARRARLQRVHGRRRALGDHRAPPRRSRAWPARTAVHICYGYGIKANIDWKADARGRVAPVRADLPAAGAEPHRSGLAGVRQLEGAAGRCSGCSPARTCWSACIDVASRTIETPDEVAATIRRALEHVPPERLYPCTNCGMVPLSRDVARGKLQALGAGARLVRRGARRLMYDADPRQGSLGEVDAGWFGTDEGTLPLGAPFRPGLDPLPARQHAWAVVKDRWGRPAHGEPRSALRRVTLPVRRPAPTRPSATCSTPGSPTTRSSRPAACRSRSSTSTTVICTCRAAARWCWWPPSAARRPARGA